MTTGLSCFAKTRSRSRTLRFLLISNAVKNHPSFLMATLLSSMLESLQMVTLLSGPPHAIPQIRQQFFFAISSIIFLLKESPRITNTVSFTTHCTALHFILGHKEHISDFREDKEICQGSQFVHFPHWQIPPLVGKQPFQRPTRLLVP